MKGRLNCEYVRLGTGTCPDADAEGTVTGPEGAGAGAAEVVGGVEGVEGGGGGAGAAVEEA